MQRIALAALLISQLIFDLYCLNRFTGIESYLANDWKGSDICDRVNQIEERLDDIEWRE